MTPGEIELAGERIDVLLKYAQRALSEDRNDDVDQALKEANRLMRQIEGSDD